MPYFMRSPPFDVGTIQLVRDADWDMALPVLRDDDAVVINLTDKTVELHVRPAYDHSILFLKLSTAEGTAIRIVDAAAGEVHIFVARHQWITLLPDGVWHFFLLVRSADESGADGIIGELLRGELIVNAGLVA